MARAPKTLRQYIGRWIETLNFEMHLIQHGVSRWPQRHPWLALPPTVLVLALLWSLYWVVYPASLALMAVAAVAEPAERAIRELPADPPGRLPGG